MGEKKSLSFSNNCKGQEYATVAEDHVAGSPTVAHALPPRGARLVVGSRPGDRFGHLPRTQELEHLCLLRGRTVCFHLCHLKAGLLAPKGSARPRCCAGALAARGASCCPRTGKALLKGGVPLGPLRRRPLSPLAPHGG